MRVPRDYVWGGALCPAGGLWIIKTVAAGVSCFPGLAQRSPPRGVEESLVRLVDSRAVLGGEQVQQKAADHGHAEPGVGPGRPFVGAGFDQGVGDGADP